ncbi:hypothetical protein M0812_05826 [Anaeramoeba flamelloides]|uniref:Uncharacterized protein n=1 Tax=Anaeramoeba flamelloides TaxID=1746091 RepID=A0AAV8A601_9EUKA|nr:hypothetical protein M0812_05826 [Anaeramoeba flamelloides]
MNWNLIQKQELRRLCRVHGVTTGTTKEMISQLEEIFKKFNEIFETENMLSPIQIPEAKTCLDLGSNYQKKQKDIKNKRKNPDGLLKTQNSMPYLESVNAQNKTQNKKNKNKTKKKKKGRNDDPFENSGRINFHQAIETDQKPKIRKSQSKRRKNRKKRKNQKNIKETNLLTPTKRKRYKKWSQSLKINRSKKKEAMKENIPNIPSKKINSRKNSKLDLKKQEKQNRRTSLFVLPTFSNKEIDWISQTQNLLSNRKRKPNVITSMGPKKTNTFTKPKNSKSNGEWMNLFPKRAKQSKNQRLGKLKRKMKMKKPRKIIY